MALGLDGFLYEVTADGKTANFHFWDPEDVTNVADASVSDKDSNGAADERSNAELAYSQVSTQLIDKRTARRAKAEAEVVTNRQNEAARTAAVQKDFLNNSQEQAVAPAGTEKRQDGVTQTVYNVAPPEEKKAK